MHLHSYFTDICYPFNFKIFIRKRKMGIDSDLILGDYGRTHFTCTICTELLEDPVIIRYCEHAFCKLCLRNFTTRQLGSRYRCPECRTYFTHNDVIKPFR